MTSSFKINQSKRHLTTLCHGSDRGVEHRTEVTWRALPRASESDVEHWADPSQCQADQWTIVGSALLHGPTEYGLQWNTCLPWKWNMTDGPQVGGCGEISCPEDGDVLIVDQRPASVAARYLGHRPQQTYTEAESIYVATACTSEEVCDILQIQKPIRRELRFPVGGTMSVARARPASVAGKYVVRECDSLPEGVAS